MSSPHIVNLTQATFAQEVLQSKTPVLVDFWAEWCGPCKQIAPVLGELAEEYAGTAKIVKVNIEEASNQDLAVQFGVRSIPTFIVFKGGEVNAQHVGISGGKPKLKSLLEEALA